MDLRRWTVMNRAVRDAGVSLAVLSALLAPRVALAEETDRTVATAGAAICDAAPPLLPSPPPIEPAPWEPTDYRTAEDFGGWQDAPLGVGHLKPESPDYLFWPAGAVVPIYAAPGGGHLGWVESGWVTTDGARVPPLVGRSGRDRLRAADHGGVGGARRRLAEGPGRRPESRRRRYRVDSRLPPRSGHLGLRPGAVARLLLERRRAVAVVPQGSAPRSACRSLCRQRAAGLGGRARRGRGSGDPRRLDAGAGLPPR